MRNKLLSILSAVLCIAGVFTINANVAFAEESTKPANSGYDYNLRFSLYGTDGFEFNKEAVSAIFGEDAKISGDELVVSHIPYGKHFDVRINDGYHNSYFVNEPSKVDPDGLIYYVKGIRVAGEDAVVGSTFTDKKDLFGNAIIEYSDVAAIDVTGDEDYVIAYGVGQAVPYTVRYVDKENNNLLPDEEKFGAKDRKIYVPSKHIDGYVPDAYFKTNSNGLAKGDVYTFVYTSAPNNGKSVEDTVINKPDTVTEETVVIPGETKYEYQTKQNPVNTDTTATAGTGNRGTANNANDANAAGNANQANNEAAGAGNDDRNGTDDSSINVPDETTPKEIIDIADEETARFGGKKGGRGIVSGIIIAAVAVVAIVAAFIAMRKRQRAK